jgi:uncharacterized protein YndB with AHSA1/START domain
MRRSCEAGITIAAPPEAVWMVVSDVTRVGEWSGECRGCEWIGDAAAPAVGSRFRGRNRRGGMRWSRVNEVVLAEKPNTLVWRTVPRFPYPDSVEWRLSLDKSATGTQVSQSFIVRSIPRIMEWALWVVMPAHRDRTGDLADDLARLKVLVEGSGDGT